MNSINRRSVLLAGLGVAGAGALAACSSSSGSGSGAALINPSGSPVAATEKKRKSTGRQHKLTLTAAPAMIDLGGGIMPRTWAFDGRTPGKEVRLSVGDTLVAELSNQLPNKTTTSIHWHGIALRNDMDGVPPATQAAVRAGSTFTYRFVADAPGTYFFHPHVGVQLDRGLYAPLVIDDPAEPGGYDDEWVVVLDDWLDGTGRTPDEVLQRLRDAGGSTGMGRMPGMGGMGGTGGRDGTGVGFLSDARDVSYPYFLVNGRVPSAPTVFTSRPGRRLRMRIVDAASDTVFALARSADNNRRGQVLASVRYRFDW